MPSPYNECYPEFSNVEIGEYYGLVGSVENIPLALHKQNRKLIQYAYSTNGLIQGRFNHDFAKDIIYHNKNIQRLIFNARKELKKYNPNKIMMVTEENMQEKNIQKFAENFFDYFGKNAQIVIKIPAASSNGTGNKFLTIETVSIFKKCK